MARTPCITLHLEHAQAILAGDKVTEYRRCKPPARGARLALHCVKGENPISGTIFAHCVVSGARRTAHGWAWSLTRVTPLARPIPAKGQQGLWYTSERLGGYDGMR